MLRIRPSLINVAFTSRAPLNYKVLNTVDCTSRQDCFPWAIALYSMSSNPSLDDLRDKWNHLYRTRLPSLAKAKDPTQPKWPVQLDHCFARIILDNAVGKDRPWAQVVKSPAYKHMSQQQLEDAIELGEKLATGEEDLAALDEKSLALRGKKSKLQREAQPVTKKRKVEREDDEARPKKIEGQPGQDGVEKKASIKRARKTLKSPQLKNRS